MIVSLRHKVFWNLVVAFGHKFDPGAFEWLCKRLDEMLVDVVHISYDPIGTHHVSSKELASLIVPQQSARVTLSFDLLQQLFAQRAPDGLKRSHKISASIIRIRGLHHYRLIPDSPKLRLDLLTHSEGHRIPLWSRRVPDNTAFGPRIDGLGQFDHMLHQFAEELEVC